MPPILHDRVRRTLVLAGATGLAVALAAPLAAAEGPAAAELSALDLGFETAAGGWFLRDAEVDATVTHGGARSMRLRRAGSEGFALFSRRLPGERALGRRVRLSGWIRTVGVDGGYAGLWVRADRGRDTVALDNMGDRGLRGDNDWTQVEVSVEVPKDATAVVFGGLLPGTGTAWFDDLAFTFEDAAAVSDAEVSGTVTGPGGEPAAGAVVAVVAPNRGEPSAVAVAGADGAFAVTVPAGTYALTATHPLGSAVYAPPAAVGGKAVRDLRLAAPAAGFLLAGDARDAGGAALAGAEVHCLRFSQDSGDLFAGRADDRGHYALRLPSASYACRVVAGGLRSPLAEVADGTARQDLVIRRPAPAPHEVVDWIRDQAVPLLTPRAGHGFADLAPLRDVVGGARVVALGEATHGTREFFQMKHRLLEYLVSELGFTVFAMEANWPESEAVDEYVRTGRGDPAEALDGLYFWTWNTEEVLDLIRWMRQWNAVPGHRQVRFYGFDMQTGTVAAERLAARLQQIDPALAAEAGPILARFAADERTRASKQEDLAAVAALLPRIAERLSKPAHPPTAADRQAAVDRQYVRVLQQYTELRGNSAGAGQVRDRAMADNVRWIADVAEPGARIVLWAHNGHIADNAAPFPWMGHHLEAALGQDYLPVGFLFHHGGFQAIDRTGRGSGLNEFAVGAPPAGSLEDSFERAGWPLCLLDLRRLPASGTVAEWFRGPQPMREIGAVFSGEADMAGEVVLPDKYEAVIYVEATTRARPNPQ